MQRLYQAFFARLPVRPLANDGELHILNPAEVAFVAALAVQRRDALAVCHLDLRRRPVDVEVHVGFSMQKALMVRFVVDLRDAF